MYTREILPIPIKMMNFEKLYLWKRGEKTMHLAFLQDGKGIAFERKPLEGRVMRTPPPGSLTFVWSTGTYKYKCRQDDPMPVVGLYMLFEGRDYFHVNQAPDVWYESDPINPYTTMMYMMEPNQITLTDHSSSINSSKVSLPDESKVRLSEYYARDFNIIFPKI